MGVVFVNSSFLNLALLFSDMAEIRGLPDFLGCIFFLVVFLYTNCLNVLSYFDNLYF